MPSKFFLTLSEEDKKEIADEIMKELGLDSTKTKAEPIGKLTDKEIKEWAEKTNPKPGKS